MLVGFRASALTPLLVASRLFAFPIEPWRAKTHLRLSSFVPLLYENLQVLIDRSLRSLGFEQLLTGPAPAPIALAKKEEDLEETRGGI